MRVKDVRELVSGILVAGLGLAIAGYAGSHYNLGTLSRMGPGMFPFGLGLLLVGLGIIIMSAAFMRGHPPVEIQGREAVATLAGVVSFALLIGSFGLLPAILGVTVISTLAERQFRPVSTIVLYGVLSILAVLIFRVGLGLPLALIRWPF